MYNNDGVSYETICTSTTNSKNILEYENCWVGTYLSIN